MIRLFLWMVLSLTPVLLHAHGGGHEPAAPKAKKTLELPNPLSEYWRKVREGVSGYSAVKGQETGVLMQEEGQDWRKWREGPLKLMGALCIALSIFGLAGFYSWRGRVPLKQARSGKTMMRWSRKERLLHGFTALLFLWLAFSGLSLMLGSNLFVPIMGHEAFAVWAGIAKVSHDITGPLFALGLFIMIFGWAKHHMPQKTDLAWFKAYGGLIGDQNPSAGRMSGGAKLWFWFLTLTGLGVIASGFVLDFPNFGQTRGLMRLGELIHGMLALWLVSASLVHIYFASIGVEGTLEGMKTGEVDESWAIQHHDLWYESLQPKEDKNHDGKKKYV